MVSISIIIPDTKVEEFKLGFLKAYPNDACITDMKHIKKFIREQLLNYYKTGKVLIARETTPAIIDEEVVSS